MVDYLFKPFNPVVLRSKVSIFVDLFRKTRRIREQEEQLRERERRELELRHRAELHESEQRCAQIVDSAMDAIISFGPDRHVRLFNEAAMRMFGYEADEALQLDINALLYPPLPAQLGAGRFPARGRSEQLYGVRADGDTFPVEASVATLELGGEQVCTVIARDITQQQQSRQRLQEQTRELERALTARSRFFASMSHELRTPINAMLGYTALLLDGIYGPLTEAQQNSIRRAHLAAEHLLELVNDVLDLSKIEAGKLELQYEPLAIPETVRDLFVTMAPLAEQHGTELSLEAGESFSIVTDSRRVRQIVLNLLSNAVKFGAGKPVRVVCRREPDGGATVEVQDHGIGIAEADQERIFDEFEQLDHGGETQGTGLGLPISRRLAMLLGGSLTVASAPGVGSTFRLQLPAAADEVVPEEPSLSVA